MKSAKQDPEVWNFYFAKSAHARRKIGKILADPTFERARQENGRPDKCDTMSRLSDLGIARKESSRWQALARIQKNSWTHYFRDTAVLTFAGLYHLAKIHNPIDPPEGKYEVIVLDPPWPSRKIKRIVRPNQAKETREYDYEDVALADVAQMDLPAADDCHVFLWITIKLLPFAFEILRSWGARYVFTMSWHKPGGYQPQNLPQYNWEPCVYGRIGKPIFVSTKGFSLCFEAPKGKHSEKPDFFYEMISKATKGMRINMFARKERLGFQGWGIEYD